MKGFDNVTVIEALFWYILYGGPLENEEEIKMPRMQRALMSHGIKAPTPNDKCPIDLWMNNRSHRAIHERKSNAGVTDRSNLLFTIRFTNKLEAVSSKVCSKQGGNELGKWSINRLIIVETEPTINRSTTINDESMKRKQTSVLLVGHINRKQPY